MYFAVWCCTVSFRPSSTAPLKNIGATSKIIDMGSDVWLHKIIPYQGPYQISQWLFFSVLAPIKMMNLRIPISLKQNGAISSPFVVPKKRHITLSQNLYDFCSRVHVIPSSWEGAESSSICLNLVIWNFPSLFFLWFFIFSFSYPPFLFWYTAVLGWKYWK